MDAIVKAALFTPGLRHRWGLPMILKGEPGTAKSAKVESLARESGLHCETVIASLRDPSDFLGTPIPLRGKGKEDVPALAYAPPAWALRAAAAGRAIVFLDEINTAPPSVQAALLRVVLEGVVGDLVLPEGVRFMAAMNSVDDAAGGWDLAAPLANRFGHYDGWDGPGAKDWVDWLLGKSSNGDHKATEGKAEELEKEVLERWPSDFAQATGLVAGFVLANSAELHKKPATGSPDASGAWASRRTWEMATRALAASRTHGLNDVDADQFIGGFIGRAAARTFRVWRRSMDLPDPAKLLDGEVKFDHDSDRLDRTLVVMSSCAALVSPQGAAKRKERSEALWKIMQGFVDTADVIVPAARVLCKPEVGLGTGGAADKVLRVVWPVLSASGYGKAV